MRQPKVQPPLIALALAVACSSGLATPSGEGRAAAPATEPTPLRSTPPAEIERTRAGGEPTPLTPARPAALPVPPVVRIPVYDQERIDAAIAQALSDEKLPGCVVLMGRSDGTLFRRAYGAKALLPEREAMTEDTLFDIASITKAVVTATAAMLLAERGRLRLDARVARYLPEFARGGKGSVRVVDLLLHRSGLPAVNSLSAYAEGPEQAIRNIMNIEPAFPPGSRYVYSDLGYIVLGELIARVSGQSLDQFARVNIFEPLGMSSTQFNPDASIRDRAAPTEQRDEQWIRGVVHDPRAYRLGGVAGNAGLFTTADDLARFATMMLRRGTVGDTTILPSHAVGRMIAPEMVGTRRRGLGWDLQVPGMSSAAYGHGGFTGTGLWIDPARDVFLVFLSNRVHPEGQGDVLPLIRQLRYLAVDVSRRASPPPPNGSEVTTGVDELRRSRWETLRGAKVGLLTNVSGRARDGKTTLDLLVAEPSIELVRVFTPEHGLSGHSEGRVRSSTHAEHGFDIVSLFGRDRRPSAESLEGIDTLVFDVQDVGTRYYTYMSTMRLAMEAAAEKGIRFVVLDRPNPIGDRTEGPILEVDRVGSFVNYHALPVRHGLTAGELARLLNVERSIGARLEVVPVRGWTSSEHWSATGLPWVAPSPNLGTAEQTLLYPATGLLEATNLSVGRGTNRPFEIVGAPWLDSARLLPLLRAQNLPGVSFSALRFRPRVRPYRNENCRGLRLTIENPVSFRPVRTGLALAQAIHQLHGTRWEVDKLDRILGSQAVLEALRSGATLDEMESLWEADLRAFEALRAPYRLYGQASPTTGSP